MIPNSTLTLRYGKGDVPYIPIAKARGFTARWVKVTFYEYPFNIKADVDFDSYLRMPDLLTLAAMKAYALGRRSKWKDYVDLFFILRDHLTISNIKSKAQEIFGDMFFDKVFAAQLSYYADISYEEMPISEIYFSMPVYLSV